MIEQMIDVQGVAKIYGKKDSAFAALTDVSFKIPNGSTVAIIGKSGSGKSTLMHIMSGLECPADGQIGALLVCLPTRLQAAAKMGR